MQCGDAGPFNMMATCLHHLVLAMARVRACALPWAGALVLATGISLTTLELHPAVAGERPDGAHPGVLIEPLADVVDSHGGAGSVGASPAPPMSPLRVPQPSAAGPAVLDSWSSRGAAAGNGAVAGDGGAADLKQVPERAAPLTTGNSQSGDAAVRALFDLAREALDQGRAEEAQSLLERLVVEAPHSALAKEARRQLGVIYRSAADGPVPDTATLAPAAHVPAPDASKLVLPGNGIGALTADAPRSADAAAPAAVAAPAPWRERARPTQRFEEMLRAAVGDRIFFSVGSTDLGGRARTVLERQAEWIGKYPDLYVVVEGHADEPGGEDVNTALALRRAELVRARLVESGVAASRIDVHSRGSSERAVTCDGAICRSQNSRVVTRLMVVLPATAGNRAPQPAGLADRAKLASGAQGRRPPAEPPPRR